MWAHSLSQFLAMGGYAFFVWTSFGVAFAVLTMNVIWSWLRLQRVRRELGRAAYRRKVERHDAQT